MFARSLRAGLAVTALVASGLALAGPALADPSSTPASTDYAGVGSDTTQFVVNDLAAGYNAQRASGSPALASFDACVQTGATCVPGGTITVKSGAAPITRPNGSGAGKSLLYGSGNNTSIDFARSSSGLSTAETAAGLVAYPYAVDYLVSVVSSSVASNAPGALSIGQILGIYNGTFTNWAQLGGANGAIKPYIPQTGSGTRSFFLAQLQAANGGVAPTLASTVTETQEHDPTAIKNDPNAIAPFSRGRADGTIRIENGWVAQRDVYNVVRGSAPSGLTDVLASSGYLCGTAARTTIETDGFRQLAGGCGVPTTTSGSNFAVNGTSGVPTAQSSLDVSGGSRGIGSASNAVVTVNNGGTGNVTITGRGFSGVGAVNGNQASIAIPAGLPTGSYPITANYSGDATHLGSSGAGTLTVNRAGSTLSVSVKPAKAKKHKKSKAFVVTARVGAAGVAPTGAVVVKKGPKVVGVGSLRGGVATLTVPMAKLKKGKNVLAVSYLGDGNVVGAVRTVTVKRKR